jgi:hypothetical protein
VNINPVDTAIIGSNPILPSSADDTTRVTEQNADAVPQNNESTEQDVAADTGDKAKGVIRNLLAGHFKGVADVRLRINFHEEISALEQAEMTRIADEGVIGLVDAVNSEIEALLQTGELDEQAVAAITEAKDMFNSAVPQETDGLVAQLQSGFDNFVSSIRSAVNPTPEPDLEEPVETSAPLASSTPMIDTEPAVVADDVTEPEKSASFDIDQFIAQLVETFSQKLQELEMALNDVQVLPELSQPRGNGVAYDKFLAAYNELRGSAEAEPLPDRIDAIM